MDNTTMQITAVTLRRGGSRGFFPAYEVTLRADGSADWNGERFVLRIGRFYGQFDVRNFAKLAMFVERVGFFGWKDEYSGGGTDAPDYELVVAAGMRTKRGRTRWPRRDSLRRRCESPATGALRRPPSARCRRPRGHRRTSRLLGHGNRLGRARGSD